MEFEKLEKQLEIQDYNLKNEVTFPEFQWNQEQNGSLLT